MGCPSCGNPLNGYVELGTVAYSRVQRGQCPQCGRSLAGTNISVGFQQSNRPAPSRRLSDYEAQELRARVKSRTNKLMVFSFFGAFLGLLPSMALPTNGKGAGWWVLWIFLTLLFWVLSWGFPRIFMAPVGLGKFDPQRGTFYHTEEDFGGHRTYMFFVGVNAVLLFFSLIRLIAFILE